MTMETSSSKSNDGLTFGPAWLRNLSNGDNPKMSGLPPSPGMTFQLAKYRYGREEMLAIYETIEKLLVSKPPPKELVVEFEDLFQTDIQRPILLFPPSLEEQKSLSTCVNSPNALAAYNKLQGSSSTAGRDGTTGKGGRGGRNGTQDVRGEDRGAGGNRRGTGRNRVETSKQIDEGNSTKGATRGRRKEYSKVVADDSWRTRTSVSEPDESEDKHQSIEDKEESDSSPKSSSSLSDMKKQESKSKKEWKNQKESKKTNQDKNRFSEKKDARPEWFNDEEKKTDPIGQKKMTFDENGNFVPLKEEKSKEVKKVEDLTTKMSEALVIEPDQTQNEINQLNQQFQQTQAQLQSLSSTILKNTDPKIGGVPIDHPDADRWFYLDSQNQVQGSFSAEQMASWLSAGYFTTSLMVKRGCDEKFVPLGVITQTLLKVPFSAQAKIPKPQPSVNQTGQAWPQEQFLHQMQVLQQMQSEPQKTMQMNIAQQKSSVPQVNVNAIMQQIQQIKIQQKAAVAQMNTLGVNTVAAILQELRNKQEALLNQLNLTKQKKAEILNGLDRAILETPNQPVRNDHIVNNLIQQLQQIQAQQKAAVASINTLGVNTVAAILQDLKVKQEALLGQLNLNQIKPNYDLNQSSWGDVASRVNQTSLMNPMYQMKLKREEEVKLKQQEEEAIKRAEEERIRELIHKKRLEVFLKEEEKRRNDELQKMRDDEKCEFFQKKSQEDATTRKMLLEQIKLNEVLNAQQNSSSSVLGSFLRHQQSSHLVSTEHMQSFPIGQNRQAEFSNESIGQQQQQNQMKVKDDFPLQTINGGFYATEHPSSHIIGS